MARWNEIETAEPALARSVRGYFDAHVHKTLATLRADGSPRISGIEADFIAGDLWFGSMPGARKARDLRRDPRFALHSASEDPPDWEGDAKVSGSAEEIDQPDELARYLEGRDPEQRPTDFHLFRADIAEPAVVRLNDARDKLVIEHWAEDRGLHVLERA